jgi:hypothetical protein
MSRIAVFSIEDGEVTALAGGPLSLADMGQRSTERASHLEFNADLGVGGEWEVTDHKTGVLLFTHADYDVALQWEADHYNQLLLEGGAS